MGFAKLNRWLRGVALSMLASAVVILAIAVFLPLGDFAPSEADFADRSPPRRNPTSSAIPITLADFGEALQIPLQRPLEDRPVEKAPPPAPAPKPPPPRIDMVLLGTAVESLGIASAAWVKPKGQGTQMLHVGDVMEAIPGEPKVKAIEVRRLVLDVHGTEVVIEMDES